MAVLNLSNAPPSVIPFPAFPGLTPQALRYAVDRRRGYFDELIKSSVLQPAYLGRAISGQLVSEYLRNCHSVVAASLVNEAAVFSKAAWLWYLRRLPDWVFIEPTYLVKNSDYARLVADTVTAIGGSDCRVGERSTPEYELSHEVTDVVLRFITGVKYLSNIGWLLRSAGRGFSFSFVRRPALPTELRTPNETAAVKLYLERLDGGGGRFLKQAGTRISEATADPESPTAILGVGPITARWYDSELRNAATGERRTIRIAQRYELTLIEFAKLARFVASTGTILPGWPRREFFATAVLLRCMVSLVKESAELTMSAQMCGYCSTDYDFLVEKLGRVFIPATENLASHFPRGEYPMNVTDLLSTVSSVPSTLLPLHHAAVYRKDGNLALVDLEAGIRLLDKNLSYPQSQGAVANFRANHFEDAVQTVIDQSGWRPDDELKRFRGRTLKLHGRQLTDVDALGSSNDALLLVSAKSRIYTVNDDLGDYRAIRNASSVVEHACDAAANLEATLHQFRRGQNYDFSHFKTIVVVVCTPFAIYTPLGVATASVFDGLRRAVALGELAEFLRAT